MMSSKKALIMQIRINSSIFIIKMMLQTLRKEVASEVKKILAAFSGDYVLSWTESQSRLDFRQCWPDI